MSICVTPVSADEAVMLALVAPTTFRDLIDSRTGDEPCRGLAARSRCEVLLDPLDAKEHPDRAGHISCGWI